MKVNSLYYTPKNAKEIEDWIDLHCDIEKIHLIVLAGMIQNFYATNFIITPKETDT